MPGRNGADNKFGVSPFIVGTTLGDGCNFSTIQSAINACFAAGGGVVWIRPGVYTENLTFQVGVDLNSTAVEGRLPTSPTNLNHVTILGSHTFAPATGTFVEVVCQYIAFVDPAFGDCITVSPTVGTFAIFAVKFCTVISNSGGGAGRAFVTNPDVTSFALIANQTTRIDGGLTAFDMTGVGSQQAQVFESDISSASGNAMNFASGGCSAQVTLSTISGGIFGMEDSTGTGQLFMDRSTMFGGTAPISFTVAGGFCNSTHCTYSGGGANAVIGTGTFSHADTIFQGASSFAGTVTETKQNWQPYCSTAAAALGSFRGTASFDSSQFSVTDGWVQFTGASGITTLTANDASTTTGANILLNGVDGITTSNAGAGTINIDNKRWLSAFVVDVAAVPNTNNAEYTSINAAITAATSPSVVFVRHGTYVENVVFKGGVDVIGVAGTGRLDQAAPTISGTASFNVSGFVTIENLNFETAGGAVPGIQFNNPGGGGLMNIIRCAIDASAGTFALDCIGGGVSLYVSESYIVGNTSAINVNSPSDIHVRDSTIFGNAGSGVQFITPAGSQDYYNNVFLCSTDGFVDATGTVVIAQGNKFTCTTGSAWNQTGGVGSYEASHNTYTCGSATGNYIRGVGATYFYADEVNIGSAKNIDPAVVQAPRDWKPYGTAGTSVTAIRGTAGYDSTQFTVTNGFVQFTGAPFSWVDQGGSVTVNSNQGNFATAAITLTLPAAPVQGDTCEFKLDAAGPLVVAANAGQTLRFGSATGTTATTSAQGDAVILTYRAASTTWLADSIVGVWTVV